MQNIWIHSFEIEQQSMQGSLLDYLPYSLKSEEVEVIKLNEQ